MKVNVTMLSINHIIGTCYSMSSGFMRTRYYVMCNIYYMYVVHMRSNVATVG